MEILSPIFCAVLMCLVSISTGNSTTFTPSILTTPLPTISVINITTNSTTPTTAGPNTTTTALVNTTSAIPVTTTPVTTSSSGPITSTTPVPTITSSVPTTTSASDKFPRWNYEKDGEFCILLQMQATISFNNISNLIKSFDFTLYENNTFINPSSSSCTALDLNFTGSINNTSNILTGSLLFNFQNDSKGYHLPSLDLTFQVDKEPLVKLHFNTTSFDVKNGLSYQCISEQKLKFNDQVTMDLRNFDFDAYRGGNSTIFRKADTCSQDDHTSDVVPIAVGCALAGLVVIILIAYLIGRRRNRQRGYQSV